MRRRGGIRGEGELNRRNERFDMCLLAFKCLLKCIMGILKVLSKCYCLLKLMEKTDHVIDCGVE